jgi:hypothetical protein
MNSLNEIKIQLKKVLSPIIQDLRKLVSVFFGLILMGGYVNNFLKTTDEVQIKSSLKQKKNY